MAFTEKSLRQFVEELASGAPVPGGGSAAALTGATGAALVSMVCNLTVGREKFRDVEAEMQEVLAKSDALHRRLLDLLEADTRVYSQVMSAYRLPRAADAEKRARTAAIQEALKAACQVPLDTARACAQVIELCPAAAEKGNVSAVSDVGVGAILAAAALESAGLNVMINLASIRDAEFVEAARREMDRLQASALALKSEVVKVVESKLQGS